MYGGVGGIRIQVACPVEKGFGIEVSYSLIDYEIILFARMCVKRIPFRSRLTMKSSVRFETLQFEWLRNI